MNEVVEKPKVAQQKSGFTSAEYNDVAMRSELGAINLLATKFDVNAEFLNNVAKWNLSYDRKVLSCRHDAEDNFVAAIFRYEVSAKVGRKKAMVCSADYGVYYSTPEGAPEAAALGFCRNVGSFAAYPYFRALVAQLTWNAGVNLPPLPGIASTAHIPKPKPAEAPVVENNVDG